MSKMMDNLARVLEPEKPDQPETEAKKPSLFVVNRQAPASSPVSRQPRFTKRVAVVWGVAAVACAGLGFLLLPSAPNHKIAIYEPAAAPSAPIGDGAALIRGGRFTEAKAELDAIVAAHPSARVPRLNRAYVLQELGDIKSAETEYQSLLARFPGDAVVLNNLGALYLRAGRHQEAGIALERAVAADPAYVDARINLAALYERRQDWGAALRIFEDLLASPAGLPDAAKVRERVRRLRSLTVGASAPKEKI